MSKPFVEVMADRLAAQMAVQMGKTTLRRATGEGCRSRRGASAPPLRPAGTPVRPVGDDGLPPLTPPSGVRPTPPPPPTAPRSPQPPSGTPAGTRGTGSGTGRGEEGENQMQLVPAGAGAGAGAGGTAPQPDGRRTGPQPEPNSGDGEELPAWYASWVKRHTRAGSRRRRFLMGKFGKAVSWFIESACAVGCGIIFAPLTCYRYVKYWMSGEKKTIMQVYNEIIQEQAQKHRINAISSEFRKLAKFDSDSDIKRQITQLAVKVASLSPKDGDLQAKLDGIQQELFALIRGMGDSPIKSALSQCAALFSVNCSGHPPSGPNDPSGPSGPSTRTTRPPRPAPTNGPSTPAAPPAAPPQPRHDPPDTAPQAAQIGAHVLGPVLELVEDHIAEDVPGMEIDEDDIEDVDDAEDLEKEREWAERKIRMWQHRVEKLKKREREQQVGQWAEAGIPYIDPNAAVSPTEIGAEGSVGSGEWEVVPEDDSEASG